MAIRSAIFVPRAMVSRHDTSGRDVYKRQDNVHFQNSVEMARALNRCGKQYDMMVYPDQNHSMQPDDTANVRQKMIEYTLEHL